VSNVRIIIGLDDTDNYESRGTGRLARLIAGEFERDYRLLGVTRHQLLVDPRVPYTSHNSSAAIGLEVPPETDLPAVFARVHAMMMADFQPGSDPGLCLALSDTARSLIEFGNRAQHEIVTQAEARQLAAQVGVLLAGLGGSQDGVIGALAAAGLAASGEDGRYLLVGHSRDLSGRQPVEAVLEAGILEVRTLAGVPLSEGMINTDKLRPARRNDQPVLFVEWIEDCWQPVKLD
jgi:tRNA(Ile2) C34 agmatinyltransferase TiaS